MRRVEAVAVLAALALGAAASPPAEAQAKSGRRTVEIRSYNLKPGGRAEFHRIATEVAVPMLRKYEIDVVAFGPSPHDETSYYVIRSFADAADRTRREDAFYGSTDWKSGPRDAVLALIESYTTVVLELDEQTLRGLRRP